MPIMCANMHDTGTLRRIAVSGVLLDRQCVDIGSQSDGTTFLHCLQDTHHSRILVYLKA